VGMHLTLTPDANVSSATEEACRVAQDTIEQKIGVALVGLPTVQIRFAPATATPPPKADAEEKA
jgi:hypothetical protein